MAIRNRSREELLRLECKTLDARFKNEVQQGLNCSPSGGGALSKIKNRRIYKKQVRQNLRVQETRKEVKREIQELRPERNGKAKKRNL